MQATELFRRVRLPSGIPGKLLLTNMPAYYDGDIGRALEAWETLRRESGAEKTTLVSLVSDEEIAVKSPEYGQALASGRWPGQRISHPVPDFGVPPDIDAFRTLVGDLSRRVQEGETVVMHCAAGVGRTGTAAVCLLLSLGLDLESAARRVKETGSGPESAQQRKFVAQFQAGA